MPKISKVLVFILTALVAIEIFHKHSLAVLNPHYHWRTFTRLDGLAGNNVRAILQPKAKGVGERSEPLAEGVGDRREHSNGDIWFATSAGVSRFNELWQRYTKAEGLADNDVIGIVEANDGSLWFATRNGVSVAFINPELPFDQPSFKSFRKSDGLVDNQISAITKDTDGNIWVGTPTGASKFNGEYWESHQEAEGLLFRGVTAVFAASGGFAKSGGTSRLDRGSQQMWFGIRASFTEFSAVSRFDGESWAVFTTDDGIPNGNIHSIVEDSVGNIWIATSNGAARFDGHNWDTFTVADGLAGNNVQTIMLDDQRSLWFGTNNGVSVIDIVSSFSQQPFERSWRITTEDGLVSNNIQAILEDGNGRLWLGTSSRGVNFSDRSWQIFTVESGLVDNSITAITEDKIGNLWVGALNGLCRIPNSEFRIPNSEGWEIFTIADGLPGNEVRSLTVDKTGDVWVGTDRGIGVFDGIGFRQYTQRDGLSSNSVHTLATDSAGNIWAGTGVFIGEPDPFGRFVGLSKFDGTNWFRIPDVDAIVSTLFEDSSGNIWIGTFRDGIRILNSDVIQKFTITEGLASNTVYSIIEDAAGRIWVGTANGISILLDVTIIGDQNPAWMTLTTDDGLIDNRVQSLFLCSTGEIWIGTASGVSVVSSDMTSSSSEFRIPNSEFRIPLPDAQQWTTFTVSDGLASNDIGTIFESSDGSLWLGSSDGSGLTRCAREKIAPRTRITSGPRGIVGERSVTFEYEGGDASTPKDELFYSSRIDLEDWSPFTTRTIVRFSNLADKMEHEFVVRARDKYGNVDRVGDRARFYVDAAPPFVKITNPTDNQVIGRTYDIIGTATDETDFKEYKIQTPDFVYKSSKPVEDGILASWNSKNLSDGRYTIRLTAKDIQNGEYDIEHISSEQVPIIVDNTKPKVEIKSPKTGATCAGRIEIIAFLEDIHLDSYTLKYTQAPETTEEPKQIRFGYFSGGELRCPWDSSSVYGKTTLILEARDKAGNIGSAEITLDLNNGTALPITRITQPTVGQVIGGDADIIGTADDSTLSEFTLEYSSEANPMDYKEIKRSTFPIKNDILAVWNTVDIPDGNYILRLTAEDDNDYTNETTVAIKIDNTPPVASINSPTNGVTLSSSSRTLILGSAMDTNFDRYTLEYAQQPAEQWNLISDSNEPINVEHPDEIGEGTLGIWNTSGFDGEYFLKLTVWDKAGLESSDSIMIILDDSFPNVQISSPKEREIVSDVVEIVGTAEDDNFAHYEVAFQKEGNGDDWQKVLIDQTSRTTFQKNSLLAVWNTLEGTSPLNGDYVIRLTAFDKSGHEKPVKRTVIVDNKAPEAFISQPVNYQQVSAEVRLIGTADDENFREYVIEYGQPTPNPSQEGNSPQKWDSVAETSFLKGVRDNLLTVWNTPSKAGKYTIRLSVIDKAQHQNEAKVIVNVKEPILRSTGGEATDNNSNAKIIIPPNSLSTSTVVTINPVQNIHVCPAPSGFTHTGIAYDFEPKSLRFNKIKPATITIYYSDGVNLLENETLALLFWNETRQKFQLIGGTIDKSKGTIAAPVTKLGRYALMRTEAIPNNDANASLSALACQPRVFSPKRGECTRISFRLSQPSDVTVKIYNMAGRLQRILQKQRPMPQEWQTVVWEGKDEDQQIVPSGPYIITVTVANQSIQKSVFVWND